VLRTGLTTAAAVAGTAAALRPVAAAGITRSGAPGRAVDPAPGTGMNGMSGMSSTEPADPADGGTPLFDEVYCGRRIQGFTAPEPAGARILVDGRELELMRRVDGSWISMANHYQAYATPLDTARGAVDVIGHAQLSEAAAHHH
jgi:hypothetical protein